MDVSQGSQAGLPVEVKRPRRKKAESNVVVYTQTRRNPLESEEWQKNFKKLLSWRRQARIAQAENRTQMAIDEDFYDGIQIDPEDLKILQDRSQPPLVFNVIKNTINWILGTERKMRIDSRVLPRKKRDAEAAKAKTKLMKYTQDVSHGEYEWSQAFAECIKAGLGWIETGVRRRVDDPIFVRYERWRNMWFDHLGHTNDGSDWRYVIRERWVDLDVAQNMFPDRKDELHTLAESTNSLYPYRPDDISIQDLASEFDLESEYGIMGPYDDFRQRLRLSECWYRTPARVKLLQMRDDQTPYGALNGSIYRQGQPDHDYLVKGGYFTTIDVYALTVRQAIWAGNLYLQDILTPYNHSQFPFTPLFCYRRSRDNMPYGCIRDLRDPQDDLNRRRSKALVLLTANRLIYEKGAFDNPTRAYDEFNRPDMLLEATEGALTGKKIEIIKGQDLAIAHAQLATEDENFIKSISGVQYENTGTTKKDLSGKAILALQNQGMQSSGTFFDNYYYARQTEGEKRLTLIEQFIDQQEEFRITGEQTRDEFITVNEQREDGKIVNAITAMKSDFVVGKQDFRETMRITMVEQLTSLVESMAKSMPEVALKLLDLAIDYMDDLPNKDDIVKRIRDINGQSGPEDEMSEEEKKAQSEKAQVLQQKQAAAEALQTAMIQAKLASEEAKVMSSKADVMLKRQEAAFKRLESLVKAIEVTAAAGTSPQFAKAADGMVEYAQADTAELAGPTNTTIQPGGQVNEKQTPETLI